jgi:hypothetical protein
MTIKQHGGVFGRNPSFNNVEAESLTIAGNAVPDASTILVDGDIGSTVQAYDADTTKNDVSNTFTADQTFSEKVGIGTTTTPLGPLDIKLAGSRHVVTKYDTQNTISSENDSGSPESLRFYGDNIYFYTPQGGYAPANLTLAMHIKTQTGNLAFPSGQGIDFSATGDSSTGSMGNELFDDYEEGTWTPVYTTGSGAFGTITYDVQAASYVKVGNVCVATFRMRTDSVDPGTATNLLIGTLPFTSGSTPAGSGMVDFATTFGGDTPSAIGVAPSATTATIYYRSSANGATLAGNAADLGTGANANFFQGTIVYITG